MTKNKGDRNSKNTETPNCGRNTGKYKLSSIEVIGLVVSILAIVISGFSYNIAHDTLDNQKLIEQNTLKAGNLFFDSENNTFTISVFNNQHAAYPVYMDSTCKLYINGEVIELRIVPRGEMNLLVHPGKVSSMTVHPPASVLELDDAKYISKLEIRYFDYINMESKFTSTTFNVLILNHSIEKVSQNL